MFRSGLLIAAACAAASPALAHVGDHSHFTLEQLGEHLLEWDHLFLIGLAGAIGFMAFHAGRRSEARRTSGDPGESEK